MIDMDKIEKIPIPEDVKRVLDNVSHILIGLNYRETARDYKQAVEKLISLLEVEEPDKSLEEEIDRFEDWMETYNQSDYPTSFTTRDIARHFAEWQKSQMLKDAYVESQIVEDGRIELEGDPLPCLNPIILLPYPQFKPGNKVRIIIVKGA